MPHDFHNEEHLLEGHPQFPASRILYRWRRFLHWCDDQEVNRMAWLAVSLFVHGCLLFPLTVMVNGMAGNSMVLLVTSIAALMIMFTANLSQLPERFVLPCVFLSVMIDLAVIGLCLIHGLHVGLLFRS